MVMSIDHLIKSRQLLSTGWLWHFSGVLPQNWLNSYASFSSSTVDSNFQRTERRSCKILKPLRFIRCHIFYLRSPLMIGACMSWRKIALLNKHAQELSEIGA